MCGKEIAMLEVLHIENIAVVKKIDIELSAGMTVTVRGFGKFILRSLSDRTKKGRYRLVADRYV